MEDFRDTAEPDRGIAMRVGIATPDDNSQIDLTAVVPATYSTGELAVALDKLMTAARSVRARQQIPVRRHKVRVTTEELNEKKIRLAGMDAELETARSISEMEISKLRAQSGELYEKAATEHIASGRQGPFEPRGATKGTLQRFTVAIAVKEG